MEETNEFTIHKPVRRRKTGIEVFKEAYLPYLILLLAAVIIVVLIVGALVRNDQKDDISETAQAVTREVLVL